MAGKSVSGSSRATRGTSRPASSQGVHNTSTGRPTAADLTTGGRPQRGSAETSQAAVTLGLTGAWGPHPQTVPA